MYKYYIGLDLGSNAGAAALDDKGNLIYHEHWVRKPPKGKPALTMGQMCMDQWGRVDDLLEQFGSSDCLMSVENVQFSSGGFMSTQLMGVQKAATEMAACNYDNVEFSYVSVSTWKKAILNNTRAKKDVYVPFVNDKYGLDYKKAQEDVCAAICLALYGFTVTNK